MFYRKKYIEKIKNYKLLLKNSFIIISLLISFSSIGQSYSQSQYDLGYDYGCNDTEISNPSERYINQPNNGPLAFGDEFMQGYIDGYDECYDQELDNGEDISYFNLSSLSTQKNSNDIFKFQPRILLDNQYIVGGVLFLVLFILVIIEFKSRSRRNQKERKGFPLSLREKVLRKQDHKCAQCRKLLNVVDYDHKNGNRFDNRECNCQALCPNCHAIKTRREKSKK
ncbi:MAG: HNH endonuclease [Nitrosopumilus sp.]|nr:HNH endonuclease [Nitrosopumilus sp.]